MRKIEHKDHNARFYEHYGLRQAAVCEAICESGSGAAPLQASYRRWVTLPLAMLVVAAVVRMLLLMRLRTWLLSLLWGARFGPRLLRLLRVEFLTRGLLRLLRVIFLTRLGLRLRPGLLTRCLLDLLRVIFRPRLGLRLRAGLLTRCLLGLLRVIFLPRLGLR